MNNKAGSKVTDAAVEEAAGVPPATAVIARAVEGGPEAGEEVIARF